MCLIIKNIQYKTAEIDIICYKNLNNSNNIWFTPFNHTHFPNDVINGECSIFDYNDFNEDEINNHKMVGIGGYHCYADKNDAVNDANTCYNTHTFECVIPKGTIYYEGDFFGWKAYAVKQLQIISKIEKQ